MGSSVSVEEALSVFEDIRSAVEVEGKKHVRKHEQLTWLTVHKNFAQYHTAERKRKRAAGSDGEDQQ
jgi:hypothetical protein